MQPNELHVVLGAGQIGTLVTDLLLAEGRRVRQVRRGAAGESRPNLEWARGDLKDLDFAKRIGEGASVIYDCTNPIYTAWEAELLPLGRGSLHAARANGAKLVALDNLYMYGQTSGPMREDSPMKPVSRKGRLRAELAELRLEALAKGTKVAIGRASDFYGPGMTLAAVFGERFFQRVLAGKSAEVFGDPAMPHAYSYGADVARGLVTLGKADDALGIWHLPTNEAEPTQKLIDRFAQALGREISTMRVPDFVLKTLGVFVPLMREVAEMTYQWKAPFLLDDSKFRTRFGAKPTPVDDAVRATVAWARVAYPQARIKSETRSELHV